MLGQTCFLDHSYPGTHREERHWDLNVICMVGASSGHQYSAKQLIYNLGMRFWFVWDLFFSKRDSVCFGVGGRHKIRSQESSLVVLWACRFGKARRQSRLSSYQSCMSPSPKVTEVYHEVIDVKCFKNSKVTRHGNKYLITQPVGSWGRIRSSRLAWAT